MALKHLLAASLATAALSACAIPTAQAAPDDIFLLNNRLTVIFSNGMQCRVENIRENPVGEVTNCPVPARYDITFLQRSYFGDSLTEPYADVTIIKPGGYEYDFKRPRSREYKASIWDWNDDLFD